MDYAKISSYVSDATSPSSLYQRARLPDRQQRPLVGGHDAVTALRPVVARCCLAFVPLAFKASPTAPPIPLALCHLPPVSDPPIGPTGPAAEKIWAVPHYSIPRSWHASSDISARHAWRDECVTGAPIRAMLGSAAWKLTPS